MATPTQFSLTHKELVELIVKHANIHEGRWSLTLGFGFSPGVFGPNEDQSSPGVAIVINQINIQREQPGLPPAANSITVDAALVNPISKKK